MKHPEGFVTNPSLVCRLKKSLYGIKQALRDWYAKINGFVLSHNYCRWKYDTNVYLKMILDSIIIIFLYVDDLLITGCSMK